MFFLLVEIFPISAQHRPVEEPYQLAGKRIVFTNWYFIRPPDVDWLDNNKQSVYWTNKSVPYHGEANFISSNVPHGIRLFVEPAQREISIIPRDRAWDKGGIRLSTLINEDGKYRLWGEGITENNNSMACYFESTDGINWQKPNLGMVEFEGNRNNNLLSLKKRLSVFIDPSAPPEERYKTIFHMTISQQQFEKNYKDTRPWYIMVMEEGFKNVHAIGGAVSSDGYNWKELEDPITIEHGDTQNIGFYDLKLNKYVLYTRKHMVEPGYAELPFPDLKLKKHFSRRAIGRTESKDFRLFPLSEIIIEPGADLDPSDEFYTNCYTTIPGAPDHHLMFPMIYNRAMDEQSKILFYSSYNGKTWHRIPGPPVLETRPYGEPDGGSINAFPNLVERPNGDWILPYNGFNVPHKYPRSGDFHCTPGLMVWPKGRLTGIEAAEIGEFATIAFIIPGSKIRINALTKRTGYIKMEVVDFDGNPIEGHTLKDCDPIIGDQYRKIVTWNGNDDLGVKTGTPVWFRIEMKYAKLYGLDFE
jgi:hypothetical protein